MRWICLVFDMLLQDLRYLVLRYTLSRCVGFFGLECLLGFDDIAAALELSPLFGQSILPR